jgi:hypothetical protein
VEEEKEAAMEKDERDLLDVLKFELSFLEKGGYGRSPREAWRPVYIFEDSPTCMNYDCKNDPAPCSDCVLMQLVPPELRAGKTPCRRIQLNASGETLDSLYRYGDDHEIEETLKNWLRTTIAQLEMQRGGPQPDGHAQLANPGLPKVTETPLCQNLRPKCANPACSTAFRWTAGGKFFRFRPEQIPPSVCSPPKGSPVGLHGAHHYWLCERCSHVFTLVYDGESGVVLKLLWMELPLTEVRKQLTDAQRN